MITKYNQIHQIMITKEDLRKTIKEGVKNQIIKENKIM